jgi:hypothetical protein
MDFIELKSKIEIATRQAFLEMFEKHGKDKIYAFALYSDDGAMTVCPSTNTMKHLEQQDKDDLLYQKYEPAEWKYEMKGADKLFNEISAFCYDTVSVIEDNEETYEEEFEKFQNHLYETCIEVLEKLKSESFFKQIVGEEILLLFTATEYEFSKEKRKEIITRLNDNEYKNEYLDWLETWNLEE